MARINKPVEQHRCRLLVRAAYRFGTGSPGSASSPRERRAIRRNQPLEQYPIHPPRIFLHGLWAKICILLLPGIFSRSMKTREEAVRRIDERLGIKCRYHSLRRTFASLKVSAGVSLFKVASWCGHRTSVCEESYAHLIPMDDQIDVGLERQGATETLMRMVCSNEQGTRDGDQYYCMTGKNLKIPNN